MFDDDDELFDGLFESVIDDSSPSDLDIDPYDGRNPCEPWDTEDVWPDEEFPFNIMLGDDEIDFDD